MACPLCRKEFTLFSNGVDDLPENFFVTNLMQMKALSSVESKTSPCEACSGGDESESEGQNAASVYCVECHMKICHICERAHKAFKSTRSHKLVEIGDKMISTLQSMPLSYCDINKIDDFYKQMTSDVDNIADGAKKCREMLEWLEKEKNDFNEQIVQKGIAISEKSEQLKQMIDVHKDTLMNELSSMKQKRMREIETLRKEIERQLLSVESYKKYVDELRQKGTAFDIARASSGLHERAEELLMFGVTERTIADLGHADVTFTSSQYVIDDVSKTLGQLRLTTVKGGKMIYF